MAGLREKKKRERKSRIQHAAIELFGEKGFSTTTMEEISQKAEVGVGTLYNYYNSKGDLLLAVIEDRSDTYVEAFEKIVSGNKKKPVAALSSFIDLYIQSFSFYNRLIWREFFGNAMISQPVLMNSVWQLDMKFINQFYELVNAMKNEELIDGKADTVSLVNSIYGQIIFNIIQYLADETRTIDDIKKEMKKFILVIYNGCKP